MPFARMTFFFQLLKNGWTEIYWGSYGTLLSELVPQAQTYATKRMVISGLRVGITYIRISDDEVYRDSTVSRDGYYAVANGTDPLPPELDVGGNPAAIIATDPSPANHAFVAAKMRMSSGVLYRRIAYWRGLPEDAEPAPGDSLITSVPGYSDSFDALKTELTNGKYYFRVQDRGTTVASTAINPVTSFVAGSPPTITTVNAFPAVGTLVKLTGFRGTTDVRYTGRVATSSGNTGTLLGQVSGTTLHNPKGYVHQILPTYLPIQSVIVDGITHRPVGRPFDLGRGRSPVRV